MNEYSFAIVLCFNIFVNNWTFPDMDILYTFEQLSVRMTCSQSQTTVDLRSGKKCVAIVLASNGVGWFY